MFEIIGGILKIYFSHEVKINNISSFIFLAWYHFIPFDNIFNVCTLLCILLELSNLL